MNSGVTISSFKCASQLSCSVSISSFSSSFCSSVSLASHFSLSNFRTGTGAAAGFAAAVVVSEPGFEESADVWELLGAPKNEAMLPFALGFFASAAASSVALRLRDIATGRREQRWWRRGRMT